jgi:hypothetical protein
VARKGQFQKGQSGNPGGRPKKTPDQREVIELAKEAAPRAIGRLVELVGNADPRVAISAATAVLERAYGKPTQPLANDAENPINPPQGPTVDALAKLSADDRRQLRSILGRAAG